MHEPHAEPLAGGSLIRRVMRNPKLLWLWIGETISIVGDEFFNLTVVWVVYTASGSTLQTALVQVIWHLSDVLLAPVAGVFADRWSRRGILVAANLSAAAVVGVVAAVAARGAISVPLALVAVFLLNCATTFVHPARTSMLPEIVGRDLLTAAVGLFTTVRQTAALIGAALAGIVVAAVGAVWALAMDATSFVIVAVCIIAARLPGRVAHPLTHGARRPRLGAEVRAGWCAISGQPTVKALVWLGVLLNVTSFLGPLYPALVEQRLNAGAAAYGMINAASISGALAAGVVAGLLERAVGVGRVVIGGWLLAGVCTAALAASPYLILTAALSAVGTWGLTIGGIASGALGTLLIPEEYRGRAAGITRSLSVAAIPFSSLLGGWLADRIGVVPLFIAGGLWIGGVAGLAWTNALVRSARLDAD